MRVRMITMILLMLSAIFISMPVQTQEIADGKESIDAVGNDYLISEDGKWQYTICNGEMYLDTYLGDEVSVVIPDTIDGYAVETIPLTALFINNYTVKSVTLPKEITSMAVGIFASAYALESIMIDNESMDGFHSVDGVLYNGTQLVAYPAAKEGEEYVIPNGTTSIVSYAFYGCGKLKKVIIPDSVTDIRSAAFSRSIQAVDIVIKKNTFKTSYVDGICWQMAGGTRLVVKDEKMKKQLDLEMKRTDGYQKGTDTMAVEVMKPTPATSLTFFDGTTEAWAQADYTDKAHAGNRDNVFDLRAAYIQEPYDATDNVTWSIVSADTCSAVSKENNPEQYICRIVGGGVIYTYAGGNAILKGTDESGHELILHLTVHSPVESVRLICSRVGLINVGDTAELRADIQPKESYANNAGSVVWKSLNEDIAVIESVDEEKKRCTIKAVSPGVTEIAVVIDNDGEVIEKKMEISVCDHITNCTVDPIPTQTYLGTALKPVPVVRYRGRILTEGVDYRIYSYGWKLVDGKEKGVVYIDGLCTTFVRRYNLLEAYFDIIDGTSKPSGITQPPKIEENQSSLNNTTDSILPSAGVSQTPSVESEVTSDTRTIPKTFLARKIKYTVTSEKEVKVTGTTKKSIRSVTIPATVRYKGKTYKVTAISKKAFYNCKKLKKVTIKSKRLKSVGKNAFKGISRKAKIIVPENKYKAYRKLFKKAGLGSKTVWKNCKP